MNFYRDGILQGNATIDTTLANISGHDTLLGNQEDALSGLTGVLDEFRVDLRAQSPAWIRHSFFIQLHTN